MNAKVICALTVPLLALACSGAAPTDPIEETDPIDDTWNDQSQDDRGDATLNPVLEGRAPKRLTVDHLRRVVPQLTDGHVWHSAVPYGSEMFVVPMLELLAPSLGEADYDTTSVNFLDPIPSFMKYVDEMAASVCLYAVAEQGNDSIVRYPTDVDRNLRYLRLKFHGIHVPDGSTEGIAELRALYDDLYEQYADHPDPNYHVIPWLGVCMAVMTDPEFYIY